MFSKKRGKNLKINKTARQQLPDDQNYIHKNLMDTFFRMSENIFYEHDLDDNYIFISPQIEKILGYTPEEAIAKWQKILSDNPKNNAGITAAQKIFEGEDSTVKYELEFIAKDGRNVWLEIREATIKLNGQVTSIVGEAIDITGRKNHEDKLKRAKDDYQLMIETQSELIIKFDLEGRITFASPNYYDTFAVNSEQIIGEKFIPEIHPDDIAQVELALKNSLHEPYNCAHFERMKTVNGWRWFSWRNRCIRKSDGTVNEIISVGRDITERIESQEEIKKLALIAKETKNAVIITDQEKKIEWVNEGFTRITGYKLEEVIGKSPGSFLQGSETNKNTIQEIRNALASGTQIKTELLNYSKSGKKYWIEVNIQPILDANGNIVKYISIEADITERKAAEGALAEARIINDTLIEKANVIIVGLDSNGAIQIFNPMAEEVTGYKLEELKNKNWFEVLVPLGRFPHVWEEFNRLMKGGLPKNFENPILTKSGEEKFISWSNNEIATDGKIAGTISFGIDITKRKKAEESLIINEARLKEAQRIANIGNWEWDVKNDKVWWSDQTYKIFDVDPKTTSIVYDTYLNFIIEEDRKKVEDIIASAIEYKQNFDFDCRIKTEDGISKIINVQGNTFSEVGIDSLRMAGTLQDITKRITAEEALKISEEKFSKAFFNAPDAIILATLDEGKVLEVNGGFEKIFEFSREEAIGKTVFELGLWKQPERRDEARNLLAEYGKVRNEEGEFITKSGKEGIGELSMDIIQLRGEQCILSVLHDVTEKKITEKAIMEYQNNLKILATKITLAEQEERRRIAADLHDNIGQSLAMAKIKLTEAEKNDDPKLILENVVTAKKYLDESINRSRTITYKISSPVLYELGFVAAVRGLLDDVGNDHKIKTEIFDDSDEIFLEDEVKVLLFRAVLEIVNNAIKHSNANELNVKLSNDDKYLYIDINDNGIGFDPDAAEMEAAKKRSFGLFSIRERISFLKGEVKINSVIGEGTKITLMIPYKLLSIKEGIK